MTLSPNQDDWPCDCRACHVCDILGIAPRLVFAPPVPKPEPKGKPAPKHPAGLFDQLTEEPANAN